MSQGCVELSGSTSEGSEIPETTAHHCRGGVARSVQSVACTRCAKQANPARKARRGPRMPSVLQPLALVGGTPRTGKEGVQRAWVLVVVLPPRFFVSRGAAARPRPSRLYLALPNWDLSQRPGRVLVRHFDVVCRVARSSRNFGFCLGNLASE